MWEWGLRVPLNFIKGARLLLIAPFGSYRTAPFLHAAQKLGAAVVLATDGLSDLVSTQFPALRLPFSDLNLCIKRLQDEVARSGPFTALLGLDDRGAEIASALAPALGLPSNSFQSVQIARRKDWARARLSIYGVRVPWYQVIDLINPPSLTFFPYPVVIKPVALSGSRGVIRANSASELQSALERVRVILAHEVHPQPPVALVEAFIEGFEYALEGLLVDGLLQTLAIFDKPDPLDGPFFEETYYITPSRLDKEEQEAVRAQVEAGARAYGLKEGPIHAECRINNEGVWILEIAARTIGGLCSRLFQFGTGYSLEEVVVRHALRLPVVLGEMCGAAGVLMIPVPETGGLLRRIEGLMAADKIPGIQEIIIDVRPGQELIPLPEGASYVGFIFAQGADADKVYLSLKCAYRHLRFVVSPIWRASVI